ncbi:hypothetical protein GGR57DRAFT_454759 [Xylariaceae sp. FL1272]|nr:hypothetical protein GGR57DRAFT_454759 [Xylariaceae sp. FL1272]
MKLLMLLTATTMAVPLAAAAPIRPSKHMLMSRNQTPAFDSISNTETSKPDVRRVTDTTSAGWGADWPTGSG